MTTVGGNSPQWLVNRAARAISDGVVDVVLIGGSVSVEIENVVVVLDVADETLVADDVRAGDEVVVVVTSVDALVVEAGACAA